MRDGGNYFIRGLAGGMGSSFGAAILIPAAVIAGQAIVVLFLDLFGGSMVGDIRSFIVLLGVSFGFGLLSGVGVVLVLVVLYYLMKLLHEEISPVDYFFLVATSQVGLYVGATVVLGTFRQTWPAGIAALAVLGLLWLGGRVLRRRAETALLKRMDEEGEEFRRELRERRLQNNLKYQRRHR